MKNLIKRIFPVFTLAVVSCTPPAANITEIAIQENSIKLGVTENGAFSEKPDNTFNSNETVTLKFNVQGLKVIDNKLKINEDITLKKGDEILEKQENIHGTEGFSVDSGGRNSAAISHDINLEDNTGELILEITVKDLNTDDKKAVSFSRNITVQ